MRTPCWPALALLSLIAPAAFAAEAPSGEVVTLSPFDVTAEQAHGYTASATSTGTRFATAIADLPFSVDVVTHQFMSDFAAYDLNQQLALVAGFSPSEVSGQF